MNIGEYPTPKELKRLEKWDTAKDLVGFLNYLKSLWTYDDYIKIADDYRSWELHTGGWSGNEEIISSLEKNIIYWAFFWQKSTRGGHYWFDTSMFAEDCQPTKEQIEKGKVK